MSDETLPRALSAIDGLKWSQDAADLAHYGVDWTRHWPAAPIAVAWPRDVVQVQALVRMAAQENLKIVPSGGRTGLSGGAVAAHGELIVSLERMNRVLGYDAADRTLRVEAGVSLQAVQEYAAELGLQYPVDLAARGSCTIGGNIATNAGGIRVLKYGNTREWVAGIDVVLANGDLLQLNRGLIKNSSGYDLRHLLIGSEGTLGIVVAAELRLTDPLPASNVMLLALPSMQDVVTAFMQLRDGLRLQAFECLTDAAMQQVLAAGASRPFDQDYPVYVVCEFDADEDAAMAAFERGSEDGWLLDGVIAASDEQARQLWHYRESITESIAQYKPYKNDISVRIADIPAFIDRASAMFAAEYADLQVIWFGHIGDGNLHISVLRPQDADDQAFFERCGKVTAKLATLLAEHGGSISAEHGIGLLKRDYLSTTRSAAEIAAMRAIKNALDPSGLFNPGKVFPPEA